MTLLSLSLFWVRLSLSNCRVDSIHVRHWILCVLLGYLSAVLSAFPERAGSVVEETPGHDPLSLVSSYFPLWGIADVPLFFPLPCFFPLGGYTIV